VNLEKKARLLLRSMGWAALSLSGLLTCPIVLQANENNQPSSSRDSAGVAKSPEIGELREQLRKALEQIQALQVRLDAGESGSTSTFQHELAEERRHIEEIERRLDTFVGSSAVSGEGNPPAAQPAEGGAGTTSEAKTAKAGSEASDSPTAGYDKGFYVRSAEGKFSLGLNGLLQVRYTGFKQHDGNAQFGTATNGVNNFDVYLGRFAASGNLFDPSIKYFLQFQAITAGDSNGLSLLDGYVAKSFSKYVTVQAGRMVTPYTYEYWDSPANYLFADLSTTEFAFALPRAIGVQVYGQSGRLSYGGMVANSVRALDAGGQQNFRSKAAFIGNLQYDILKPYGYVETDPNPAGAGEPELSIWASGAYNPIESSSAFENVAAGDTTVNATTTAGFRDKFFSLQLTGYFRETRPRALNGGGLPSNNSWGYNEQAGYFVVPGKFEITQRIGGVNWGGSQFPLTGSSANSWFAGPSFPYHRVNEDSVGFNYYLYGHHAKFQASYSYLHGNTFTDQKFGASRVWGQAQLMF
jgi:hypothetical protein